MLASAHASAGPEVVEGICMGASLGSGPSPGASATGERGRVAWPSEEVAGQTGSDADIASQIGPVEARRGVGSVTCLSRTGSNATVVLLAGPGEELQGIDAAKVGDPGWLSAAYRWAGYSRRRGDAQGGFGATCGCRTRGSIKKCSNFILKNHKI